MVSREDKGIKRFFIGKIGGSESVKNEFVYSYLCKEYSWSLEDVKNLSEIELYQSIENAIIIEQKRRIEKLQLQALAVSAGQGHKKSVQKIKELSKSETKKIRSKTSNPDVPISLFDKVDNSWQTKT